MDENQSYTYNILEKFNRKSEEIESIYETPRGAKIIFKNKDVIWLNAKLSISPFEIVPRIEFEENRNE